MKKQEVISLLERFPDLVDSDELIQDLFREAGCDASASSAADPARKHRNESATAATSSKPEPASDTLPGHPR